MSKDLVNNWKLRKQSPWTLALGNDSHNERPSLRDVDKFNNITIHC